MTKKIPFLLLLLLSWSLLPVRGQLVRDKFDKMTLSENFDSSSSMWTIVSNLDNLFIVQEGEYILNRKTLVSPFAVIAGYNNEYTAFRMVSSVKMEKTQNDEGTAGLLFMAQEDGRGGFIIEFNRLKQYRIKQIAGGSYKYISGDARNNGWVKSNALSDLNLYNLVDIRTSNKNYDVYVNNAYLMSFTEPSYTTGKMGIIIGPGTKARFDFLYVFISSKANRNVDDGLAAGAPGEQPAGGPDITVLAESIIQLKTQINKLNEDNEVLKQTIEAYKSNALDADKDVKNYERNQKLLLDEIKKQNLKMDSLSRVNTELLKYKELVAGNENSDLIITLSRTVKTEKAANEELRKLNKQLSDSLAAVLKEQPGRGIQQPSGNPSNVKIQPDTGTHKGFVLPKDGH